MATVDFPMRNAMRNMTLNVNFTGVRRWRVRMWAAVQLVRLAAYVLGCGIKVDR